MMKPSVLAPLLLDWYDRNGRVLPWRGIDDLYAILVSELMLQQTRVDTVLRYFDRFLTRFPTVEVLASADEEEVMAAWSGLGFYRRARNLHRSARRIVEDHGGEVPIDPVALQDLPGIGRYTAGAILSSGRNARLPILDGNVIRVLTRVFSIAEPPDRAATQRRLWQAAEDVLPLDRPGDFNQALMDLGATLCHPQGPECDRCPFAEHCTARLSGAAEDYPSASRSTKVRFQHRVAVLWLRPDDHFLLRRRPKDGLLASLWELPTLDLADDEDARNTALRMTDGSAIEDCGTVEHRFSHRHWTIHVFRAVPPPKSEQEICDEPDGERWVRLEELGNLGIPTVTHKTIRAGLVNSPPPATT